jgi:hypothetical protein
MSTATNRLNTYPTRPSLSSRTITASPLPSEPYSLATADGKMSYEEKIMTDSDLLRSDYPDDDDDNDYFSINAIIPMPGPYALPWHYSTPTAWSRSLIERSQFRATDAILLAFLVDVAMKLYIVDGVNCSVLNITDDSGLVWTILYMVHNSLGRRVLDCGWSKGRTIKNVEIFFLLATRDLPKIRERFGIAFLQNIQDPKTISLLAKKLVRCRSSGRKTEMVYDVFRWVYGIWPESVLQKNETDTEGRSRSPITLRQWVFEYN